MAANYVQAQPDSTGKKLRTYENTVGADNVHQEVVTLADDAGNLVASTNAAPASASEGLVVRPVDDGRSGTDTLTAAADTVEFEVHGEGVVWVNFSGTWTAGTTVQPEFTSDGTNWRTAWTKDAQDQNVNGGPLTSTSAASTRYFMTSGYRKVRLRCVAFTGGDSVTVDLWTGGSAFRDSLFVASVNASDATALNPGVHTRLLPNALSKTTLGTQGFTVNRVQDQGRRAWIMHTVGTVALSTTDTLLSFTGWYNDAAVVATTTPAVVVAGRRLRIDTINVSMIHTAVTTLGYAEFVLRCNTAGVVAITSPVVSRFRLMQTGAVAAASIGADNTFTLPEGVEFPAAAGVGMSVIGRTSADAAAAVTARVSVEMIGYEY